MKRLKIPGDIDVAAEWTGPTKPELACVLAHGAGTDLHDKTLTSVAGELAAAGIGCLRFNLPYREAGRSAPDRHERSEHAIASAAATVKAPKVVLGGKSFGGRMASQLVARGGASPPALVFLGYPLHAPGSPDKLRTEHLPAIACPMLFVTGTRDPFAQPALLAATIDSLPNATLLSVEGGDHSLKVRGKIAPVGEEIVRWLHAHT